MKVRVELLQPVDPRKAWRRSLIERAFAHHVALSDAACETWLRHSYGTSPNDLQYPRPAGSTLRGWLRRFTG